MILPPIPHRDITPYRFELTDHWSMTDLSIQGYAGETDWVRLWENGTIWIRGPQMVDGHLVLGYAWDGASGLAIDTANSKWGGLVHDALYQLVREGAIPYDAKRPSDRVMMELCRAAGMSRARSKAWELAVRVVGGHALRRRRRRNFLPVHSQRS